MIAYGIDFVQIPKGKFVMGSKDDDELAWEDEKPRHILEIPYDYWAARFPVSNAQFAEFVRVTSFETRAEREGWCWVWDSKNGEWEKQDGASWKHPLGANSSLDGLEEHPVVQICWYDALAYCEWFTQKCFKDLPPGYQFRLPGEAEWEKAARGIEAREWPWGNDFDPARCNSKDGGRLCTTSVKAHSPQGDSVYGVAGMSGNIWDWTITLWGEDRNTPTFSYPYRREDGRENLKAGDGFYRVIRGGSYKDDIKGVRCACRDIDPPYYSLSNLGFRLFAAPASEIYNFPYRCI
jgi:formylglycine-generating enzyme required for sulfatase activity